MSQFCFVLFYGTNSPPFQAMINMSGGSEAEDCRAGLPPEDESNASRFCRDAESAAMAAPGAELGRSSVQLEGVAVDGHGARAMLGTSGGGSRPAALA